MSLFQSNLRKQIRNLPKILNFVKIIHYYSKLFTGVLRVARAGEAAAVAAVALRSEVNNSLIIVIFFHKIQNFRQISDLFSQI